MRVLAESLTALHEAASEAAATDTFEPFEKKVPNGVSADLCEAVAGLCHATPSVDIGISWALVRPAPIPGYFRVSFSKDTARILEEAAREFRANEPELDYVVTGWVTTLDR
jgi:hypothetical protein